MNCRGFEPVCTNDEARAYFRDKGLRYADITDGDIAVLAMFLSEEIKKSNKTGETSVNTMYLSKKINITHKPDGTIIKAFLYMNSHYFTQRECISFNEGGFIGFAGWAGQGNTNPIMRAFLRWCDKMTNNEAKWIPFFGESDKCSNCLVETNRPLMYYYDSPSPRYEQYHFCPWCGKKMKGDLIFDIETGERKEGVNNES